MKRHVEVAGGGFAGLVTATAFAQRGWTAHVHEAGPELRSFGAGLFLSENGLRVLQQIGAYADAMTNCHQAPLFEHCYQDGEPLGVRRLPMPGGARVVTLTRQDLFEAVVKAARAAGVRIRTASRIVAAEPEGVLCAEDGTRWSADLVIGADGIRSRVRESVALLDKHTVFPFGLYRFLLPISRAPGHSGRWRNNYVAYWNVQEQRRVLYVPCNSDDVYIMLGAADHDCKALGTPLSSNVWCRSFPPLWPVLCELPSSPRFDRYEVLSLKSWSVGRVAIVGDAAHAMPPTIGQGVGTAVMNALALAEFVCGAADIEEALAQWEARERPMTDHAQNASVAIVCKLFPQPGEKRNEWSEGEVLVANYVSTGCR